MHYWYNNNGQQDGPHSLDQIKSLNLPDSTLIFKTGQTDWRKKSFFKELNSTNLRNDVNSTSSYSIPPITQTNSTSNLNLDFINTPFNWWKWLLIGTTLPFLIGLIGLIDYEFEVLAILGFGLTYILLIVAYIFGNILLYRNWKLIQDGDVRTTPGKAVGFCFIPFFNLYWFFQAIHGLSIDQEKYLNEKGIMTNIKPNKGIALATCISAVIPYLGIIPFFIFGIITFVNQKNISLEILKNK